LDAPASTYILTPPRLPAVTLTSHLWLPESSRVTSRGRWTAPASFIAPAVHEISWLVVSLGD